MVSNHPVRCRVCLLCSSLYCAQALNLIQQGLERSPYVVARHILDDAPMRSKPMPVSTCFLGKEGLIGLVRLYWMKTLFQISMMRWQSPFHKHVPADFAYRRTRAQNRNGFRNKATQGPVSAILELSLRPPK